MKQISIKTVTSIAILLLALSWIISCRKNSSTIDKISPQESDPAITAMKKKVLAEGRGSLLVSNAKATSIICDPEGNPLASQSRPHTLITGTPHTLSGTPSCTDGDGDPIFTFDNVTFSCTRSFFCGSGYQISTTWLVTTQLPLTTTNTKGQLRLRNSSNAIILTVSSITPVSIVATSSTDPDFPDDIIYQVTYTTGYIDQTTYQNALKLENNLILGTTCTDPTNVATQYLATYALFIGSSNTNPCERIDFVYINPPSGEVLGSIGGCDVFGQCDIDGYTLPTQQNVQFIPISGGAVAKSVTINYFDVKSIHPGTGTDSDIAIWLHAGTYQIRYQNVASCGVSDWSAPSANITF